MERRRRAVEVRNSASRVGPGLDVRGEGGYVLLPPSRTIGAYEWAERASTAPPPGWLVEPMTEQRRADPSVWGEHTLF